ncbi:MULTISPECIES: penicillin-binding protein 2 [unclassified Streptomyces]|uniref:peptidoglycan D,D-transpeptidase FtsI family protein n=1 Tax=unclassified Streptomyces TaxID=2593676 RepID=UPI000CD5B8FF|nr:MULTISPECIES: penicillin-binding transpeptidase domain-containing protein [unclassified Streptomyces]
MNKPMRRVAVFCGLLILALLLRVNYVQFIQSDELQNDQHNRRVAIERYAHPRGDIIVDGNAITGSTETSGTDFEWKRTYTDGEMWSPVTGYASQGFGTTQLESLYDGILTGDDDRLFFSRTIDMLTGKDKKGGNVITTLNEDAQRAAFETLGDRNGAVAAINPETGAILALVSKPSYDPSSFAGLGSDDGEAWSALQKDDNENDPMLNRALRETYPPGSTFKLVTAAAALENGLLDDVEQETDYDVPFELPDTDGRTVGNSIDNVGCEDANIIVGLQWSCNNVFLGISADLGNETMIEAAESFGFNEFHDIPVRSAVSSYPEDNRPQNSQAGIGQASNRATPLQMAMVVSAIANDGKLMEPYMVDQLVAPNLNVVEQHQPTELSRPLSPENAQALQEAMEVTVEDGTGKSAEIPGVRVGGKTGTAQQGVDNKESPYAWFVSYAKTDDGSPVAVAVVVEGGSGEGEVSGGRLAAPVAKAVMEAVLPN